MEHLNQLQKINPDIADGFILTALRFYAESLVSGNPMIYFNQLQNINYPGAAESRADEKQLAEQFIQWHNQKVSRDLTDEDDSSDTDSELTKEEIDQRASDIWKEESEGLFDVDEVLNR